MGSVKKWLVFKPQAVLYLKIKNGGTKYDSNGFWCAKCGKSSLTADYLDVDHCIPRSSRKDLEFEFTNFQFLCRFPTPNGTPSCHFQKTQLEGRKWFNNDDFLKGVYDKC